MGRLLAAHVGARPDDRGFSLLPLGHATARVFDVVVPLVSGSSINFAESPETIEGDLAELSPTLVLATPRFFERIRATVELRAGPGGRVQAGDLRFGMRQLAEGARRATEGRTRAASRERTGRLLDRPLGARQGGAAAGALRRRRPARPSATTCSSGTGSSACRFDELYGQVEVGGAAFAQRGVEDAGTAGVALGAGIEARVGTASCTCGRPGCSRAASAEEDGDDVDDGWFATGDLAELDGAGRLVVRDRRSGLFATSGGDTVSAGEVADALERSPYVATAVVGGEGRPFVIALIELELEAVAEWAKGKDKPVTTYAALAADGDVRQLIAEQVEAANARLDDASRVRGFAITRQPLHDERTFTGTVQREAVLARYADLTESLYGSPVSPIAA